MNRFTSLLRSLTVTFAIALVSLVFSPAQPTQAQEILINADGPLPATQTIPYPGEEALFYLSGSAWSKTADAFIGVDIIINDQKVWTAKIFSNGTTTHRALMDNWVEVDIPCVISSGKCDDITITLQNASAYPNTITDINDYFQLILF